jgi:hypothetical protein
MHEQNTGSAEISPALQDLFIEKVEAFRPLLGEPEIRTESPPLSELDNPALARETSTDYSQEFVSGDKIVRVEIEEYKSTIPADPARDYASTRWVVYYDDGEEKTEQLEICVSHLFTVTLFNNEGIVSQKPVYEKGSMIRRPGETGWAPVLPKSLEEYRVNTKLVESGHMTWLEKMDRFTQAMQEEKEFEESVGVYSNRFTNDVYSDVMAVLEAISGPK